MKTDRTGCEFKRDIKINYSSPMHLRVVSVGQGLNTNLDSVGGCQYHY